MRESFTRMDDVLIDRLFQPLADWLNGNMALGTNRAARTAIDLASLFWILAQAGALSRAAVSHEPGLALVVGVMIVLGLWGLTTLRAVFQQKDGGAKARAGAQANPLRPGMQLHRAICLLWMVALALKTVLAPSGFVSLALLAVGVFATSAVYIGACNNQPPAWREARKSRWDLAMAAGGI